MTEKELFDHIVQMAEDKPHGCQPPFAKVAIPLHPDSPIDYEQERSKQYDKILGEGNMVYHLSVGAPHIDVHSYPPEKDRSFWVYITNGMSDFPQVLPDSTQFRSELSLCSEKEDPIFAEILKLLGEYPFSDKTFLHYYHTIPLPGFKINKVKEFGAIIPPFLLKDLAYIQLGKKEVNLLSLISLNREEVEYARKHSTEQLLNKFPDNLNTWLIDGRD